MYINATDHRHAPKTLSQSHTFKKTQLYKQSFHLRRQLWGLAKSRCGEKSNVDGSFNEVLSWFLLVCPAGYTLGRRCSGAQSREVRRLPVISAGRKNNGKNGAIMNSVKCKHSCWVTVTLQCLVQKKRGAKELNISSCLQ